MNKQYNIDAKMIDDLGQETIDAILADQPEKVKKNYSKVENLFVKGSDYTRSLIINKFIFPISQLLEMNYSWGREYLNLFPQQLKAEYCQQINSSGI